MSINFKKKIVLISSLLLKPGLVKTLLGQYHESYLKEEGWFDSFDLKEPVDKFRNPVPWLSYPAVDFLKERLSNNLKVFEFGSGNSTLFYSRKVSKIICVEHDQNWYNKIKNKLPENAQIIFREFQLDEQYSVTVKLQNQKFDIIIVDGVDRVRSIHNSIENLSGKGVLILDDSERPEYSTGTNELFENGFKKLDFWGISAGELYKKCTSIFYRNNNCLDI